MTHTETQDFLAHYGVPGMKWGKRKAASINKAVNPNAKRTKAETAAREVKIQKVKKVASTTLLIATVAAMLAPEVAHLAGVGMDSAIMAKNTSNANKAAAAFMADTRGLSSMRIIDI